MEEKTEPEFILFSDAQREWLDASYQVTSRETRWVEKQIFEVNRMKAVLQKNQPTVPIGKGCKEWIVETADEPEAPIFDDNFLRESQHEVRKSEATFYPVYMHMDYRVAMTDSDAVANSQFHDMSLPAQTIRNLTGTMAEYREKVLWRGYDISGRASAAANRQGVIDTNVKGILNTSGINTFTAGIGNDGNITAPGDGPASAADAAVSLLTDGYYGPYDLYMTPQIHGTFISKQNSTTGVSDYSLMQDLVDTKGSKMLKSWNVTKHLIPTVEASGSEANMVMIDPKDSNGAPTIIIGEAYPLHSIPDSARAAVAASGKIVWAGIVGVIRPEAVTWEENITYS